MSALKRFFFLTFWRCYRVMLCLWGAAGGDGAGYIAGQNIRVDGGLMRGL